MPDVEQPTSLAKTRGGPGGPALFALAAFFACALAGVYVLVRPGDTAAPRPENGQNVPAPAPSAPGKPAPPLEPAAPPPPAESDPVAEPMPTLSLDELSDRFAVLGKRQQVLLADYATLIAQAEALANAQADTMEGTQALRFIYQCHVQVAADGATRRQALLAYAESLEKRIEKRLRRRGQSPRASAAAGHAAKQEILLYEAEQAMAKGGYIDALPLIDTIIQVFGETDEGLHGRLLMGQFFAAMEQPRQGLPHFRRVITKAGNEDLVRRAYRDASQMLLSNQMLTEGIALLDEWAARFPDRKTRLFANLHAGVAFACCGSVYAADALLRFEAVIQMAPDSPESKLARRYESRLRSRMVGEFKL